MTRERAESFAVMAFGLNSLFNGDVLDSYIGRKFTATIADLSGKPEALKIGTILGFDLNLRENGLPSHMKTTVGDFLLPDDNRSLHWLFISGRGEHAAQFEWPVP